MKIPVTFCLVFALAACNQTAPQESVSGAAVVSGGGAEDMQKLEAIYHPLVDMHRKSKAKFDKDHAECRLQAEPQERAARAAMGQQQAGAALQVVGAVAGFIPVRGFNNAVNLSNASNAVQDIGAAAQSGAAARGANATDDYALVVNNCLARRGYRLLRA